MFNLYRERRSLTSYVNIFASFMYVCSKDILKLFMYCILYNILSDSENDIKSGTIN